MSDTSQGPGWWLASDGKWYPPETWTGPPKTEAAAGPDATFTVTQPPGAPATPPGWAAQPGQAPGYGAAPAAGGAPYPGAPPYPGGPFAGGPYGGTPYVGYQTPFGAPPAKRTNGLAIASFICSILGIFVIPCIIGIVFGFVARSQIRQSNGAQGGEGLALAGIIIGFAWAALIILGVIVSHTNAHNNGVIAYFA